MSARYGGSTTFGLTNLGQAFHAHWRSDGSDVEVLTGYITRNPAWLAESILLDTLRLEIAGLPMWQIEALWSVAAYPFHDLRREGHDGRDWLRRIIRLCQDRLHTDGRATEESAPPSPYGHLTGAVLDEILLASQGITEGSLRWPGTYVPGIVPTLNDVAAKTCPDLAFRLLLRALDKVGPHIPREQYDRYIALGKHFSYGEDVVGTYDYLVS
ncbi:hypothetical protein [Streptomyces sp. NPDC048340]|uniref:hypothetical protein n=1 Tax=Streptomyces sp. NPDC048340 TaxID=3365537 RepID=UPI00371218AD